MKKPYIITTYLFISSLLFANGAEIVYKNSHEYRMIEFNLIEKGKAAPGNGQAITRQELYSRFSNNATPQNSGFSLSGNLTVTPYGALYFSPYASYDKVYPLKMVYLHDRAPNILKATGYLALDDTLFAKFTYDIASTSKTLSDGLGTIHPLSADCYNPTDSPSEAYLSYSQEHLSLTIGRFQAGIGHGLMGNTFQNGHAPYYDQLQLNIYNQMFKFYYMLGSSNHQLNKDEKFIQDRRSNFSDYSKSWGGASNSHHKYSKPADNYKVFAFHRVEIHPTDKLTLGVGEMNLIGGKFPDFNQINPLTVYHNTYDPDYRSYTFSFDTTYVPTARHLLFSELLINEIRAPGERNEDPTALGGQIGYWYILPIQGTTKHRIAIEATHINTWTYSDAVPYLTMYQRQYRSQFVYDIPLGYSFGGDCEQFSIIYTLISSKGSMVDISLSHLAKGEVNFLALEDNTMPYEKARKWQARPSGTVERWNSIDIDAEIKLDSSKSLQTTANYSYIQNFNHENSNNRHLFFLASGISWHF
ncbi:MAG: hypothetical protein PF637_05155 [Spirochaetes bacterium]|jgi:hypothetical protein|nr:hypothetical protein [Spirochaetota bacterium]